MRFKLCILIVIAVFTLASTAPAAEFGKQNKPRVVIETTGGPIHVWVFYDTGLGMLCYITGKKAEGQSIDCTPYNELYGPTREKIDKHLKTFPEHEVPAIIQVP